jgi:precorrin-4/cobalt-precorrin-4 C11-methyltransferase
MTPLEAKVYIVGAGPGDPELITVKGSRILRSADLVLYADSLVSEELIHTAKDGAEVLQSSGMNLEQQVEAMYGAILEQMSLLKLCGVSYEIIPGVSSVFASAAAVGAELTVPELTQTVILTRAEGRTPVPEREQLRLLAAHHCTVALFLSASLAGQVTEDFLAAGWSPETPVAVVKRATWPDQQILRTTVRGLEGDLREAGITMHAMILAGWALDPGLTERDSHRSRLYDKNFTHGCREGIPSDA